MTKNNVRISCCMNSMMCMCSDMCLIMQKDLPSAK